MGYDRLMVLYSLTFEVFLSMYHKIKKIFYLFFLRIIKFLLSPLLYEKVILFLHLGYFPNFSNPLSFNEKIIYYKHFKMPSNSSFLADKWRVREFIRKKGFEYILNKIYFASENPCFEDFLQLPDSFVLKPNHASGLILIRNKKNNLDTDFILKRCKKWLSIKYSNLSSSYEMHYDDIKPLIICEKYLIDNNLFPPDDYKFWCFNGKVHFIQVVSSRSSNYSTAFYDKNWNKQLFSINRPAPKYHFQKPSKLSEMIYISENISSELSFLRVDLYLINNNKIVFGELTLFPNGGKSKFFPDSSWDYYLGRFLTL